MEDAEAKRQIDQMVSFIINEAKDKAAEIEAKAQEDFNVERLKALQAMKDKIRADYKKRAKQLETERAIAQSTAVNKARLKKMAARQIKINEAVKSCTRSLAELANDSNKYPKLCADLIAQAMVRLLEPTVLVRCRKSDEAMVRQSFDSAQKKYLAVLQSAGIANLPHVSIEIDTENYLPPGEGKEGELTCCGGVTVTSADRRIVCDNTLDTRLAMCVSQLLPELRRMLYEEKKK